MRVLQANCTLNPCPVVKGVGLRKVLGLECRFFGFRVSGLGFRVQSLTRRPKPQAPSALWPLRQAAVIPDALAVPGAQCFVFRG